MLASIEKTASATERLHLRPYQSDAARQIGAGLAKAKARLLLVLPPGAGKTETVIETASRRIEAEARRRFIVLTHRNVLVKQTARRFRKWGIDAFGATSGAWRVGDPLPEHTCVVMSPQTAQMRGLLDLLDPRYEWHLVVDEAHHGPADTWKELILEFPGPVIGMTATPWRLDRRESMGDLFEEMIVGPQPKELIKGNYLAEPIVMAARPENTIRGGSKRAGEYTAAGIMAANAGLILTQKAVEQTGRAFEQKRTRCLINVAIYTEGADFQEADCVVLLRPTESLAMHLQMACRGMRWNGGKRTIILDATDNTLRHGLPGQDREWSLAPRGDTPSGEPLVKTCPQCAVINPRELRECAECGYAFGETCVQCGRWQSWTGWKEQKDVCDDCQRERDFEYSEDAGLILEDGWGRSDRGDLVLTRGDWRVTLRRTVGQEPEVTMYVRKGRADRRRDLGQVSDAEAKRTAERAISMTGTVLRTRMRSCRSAVTMAASMTDQSRRDVLLNQAGERAREIGNEIRGMKKTRDREALAKEYDDLLAEGKRARRELTLL